MSSRDRRRYGKDYDWARGRGLSPRELAAGRQDAPRTQVAATVRRNRPEDRVIFISDGTPQEYTDQRTGAVKSGEKWFKLPRSQIRAFGPDEQFGLEELEVGKTYTFDLPVWLATKEGLL